MRVWVPACATGEEAYSIAMLITEHAEAAGKRFDLKVFATDAQEDNLRKARDGIYPAAALADFPPERIRRFFEKLDGSFQVSKELRDMVVFAAQNLLRDPPFSRLDLVSCRNFLIYLEPDAQQRIIAQLHFALRPDGHLLLGNAETIGRHDDLFEMVSKKWRVYRRVGPTRHDLIDYHPTRGKVAPVAGGGRRPCRSHPRRTSLILRGVHCWTNSPLPRCWSTKRAASFISTARRATISNSRRASRSGICWRWRAKDLPSNFAALCVTLQKTTRPSWSNAACADAERCTTSP